MTHLQGDIYKLKNSLKKLNIHLIVHIDLVHLLLNQLLQLQREVAHFQKLARKKLTFKN